MRGWFAHCWVVSLDILVLGINTEIQKSHGRDHLVVQSTRGWWENGAMVPLMESLGGFKKRDAFKYLLNTGWVSQR